MEERLVRISRRVAKALRHDPGAVGLDLDAQGWASVTRLCRALQIDRADLARIVAENDKQRFEFDPTQQRIRARQGHSITTIDPDLLPALPPDVLYHGTVRKALPQIVREGLKPMQRNHVHLSADKETAVRVGQRRGRPVVLTVRAGDLARAGHRFWLSANGVWLTDEVPPGYLIE